MKQIAQPHMGQMNKSLFQTWWDSRSFLQKRVIRFCLSMLVMVLCFPLYYAGLFGTVDGPLHPSAIGARLAGLGVTKTHFLLMFLSILIISLSWNWIFNLVSLAAGSRLTCTKKRSGDFCGKPVKRTRVDDPKTGGKKVIYVCESGHEQEEAHFHPVKKGTISHCLWLLSLSFAAIVAFMS